MLHATDIRFDIGSKRILSDVSLKLQAGEMVALCGPNGAGKSTLLRILAGEQKPSMKTKISVAPRRALPTRSD